MDSSSPQNENEDKRDDDEVHGFEEEFETSSPETANKRNLSHVHLVINQRRRIKIQGWKFWTII